MGGPPDRTPSLLPGELPELSGQVRPLRHNEGQNTFAVNLSPVVDSIRQLYTTFGMRPYRVFLVHTQWSGMARGSGVAAVISRRELLPTPKVADMGGIPNALMSTGLTEMGTVQVSEISTKYSEDDLMGKTLDLINPTKPITLRANVEFYWEVEEQRALNQTRKRRFYPASVPDLTISAFQWSISLNRQDVDRSRTGSTMRGQP